MSKFYKVTPAVQGDKAILDNLRDVLNGIDGVETVTINGGAAYVGADLDSSELEKELAAGGLNATVEKK